MNAPQRLRDSEGPARALMGGSRLDVPSASRRRALAFVGTAAAGTAVSGTAAAAATASLVKGVVLCVCLGTVGGGVASLAVSETISRIEARHAAPTSPATAHAFVPAVAQAASAAPVAPLVGEALEPAPAPVAIATPEPAATRDARASAPASAAAAAGSVAPAPAPSLFEEQRIIEAARAAVARGDAPTALATLDNYDRAYARGQFGPEALALRVEALSAAGQSSRARSLAAEFERRYPHHPLLARVQGAAVPKH